MQRSEAAWKAAYEVVQQEMRAGRPYVPYAHRPDDLPQAKIPAFPGAEGGGMYAFGGRGGKVYTVTNLNDRVTGSPARLPPSWLRPSYRRHAAAAAGRHATSRASDAIPPRP